MPTENGQSAQALYLAELDARIEQLVALRALVASGGDTSAAGTAPAGPLARPAAIETHVHPGSFMGMSVPQATRRFLEIMGKSRPQTPQAIAAALVQGNQDKPENEGTILRNIYTAFLRGKNKEGGFAKVGKLWGLYEWYPSSALAADSSSGKKKRKRKKKGESDKPPKATKPSPASDTGRRMTYHQFMSVYMKSGKPKKLMGEAWKQHQAENP